MSYSSTHKHQFEKGCQDQLRILLHITSCSCYDDQIVLQNLYIYIYKNIPFNKSDTF